MYVVSGTEERGEPTVFVHFFEWSSLAENLNNQLVYLTSMKHYIKAIDGIKITLN